MDKRIEPFIAKAIEYIKEGDVREIIYSGPTYQIEVYDSNLKENVWPFFQFDEKGALKDAFCSCPAAERGCIHLAAAYLAILGNEKEPLHVRFERSFWNCLSMLFAEHIGYEGRFLDKESPGHYSYENEVKFAIEAKNRKAIEWLHALIEDRPKETPETSIKFSNITFDEISWWKEGRATRSLRYRLSFWNDLAKWMMASSEKAQVTFSEDEQGFPVKIHIVFPEVTLFWQITVQDLEKLIPTLKTIDSPLKILSAPDQSFKKISYNPDNRTISIEHREGKIDYTAVPTRQIGRWVYLPQRGFATHAQESLLTKKEISSEDEIVEFLENFSHLINPPIPIHDDPIPIHYFMYFDSQSKWHFEGYLFEKGDLNEPTAAFFGTWAYLPHKGFFAVKNSLFETATVVLEPESIADFVTHNRIWLNDQKGFQTHLSSIEFHLSYELTKENKLIFTTKEAVDVRESKDFGEWIYYPELGFFSKRQARLGVVVSPGTQVYSWEISRFIKSNREELENVANFFTNELPITERGLEITFQPPMSIDVKPIYKGQGDVKFFGDFVYVVGKGFCELPISLRLPEAYAEEKRITREALSKFITVELPLLEKYVHKLDPRLRRPVKLDLEVHYLVRMQGGGVKAKILFVTEYGKIPVTEIRAAHERKQRYFFSEGGVIDLSEERFQWVYSLPTESSVETQTIQMSSIDLVRLDATYGLLAPQEELAFPSITQNLLDQLRTFTTHEKPIPKGLKSQLRLYQQMGLEWLWFLYKNSLSGILCDDMGLGKTHQAMALIASIMGQKSLKKRRFLVICPTSVIYHWQDKLAQFLPDLKVHTFYGLKRSLKDLPKEGLLLTTYGIARVEKKKLEKIFFDLVVFDELQVAKNPHSHTHNALLHINAGMRVGLSGTPIENNLRELKSLFDIVLPGYMPSESRFRDLFINPIERDGDEEKKAFLRRLIHPFILRRRKTEVLQELPGKSVDLSFCELSDEQVDLYTDTLTKHRDGVIANLQDQGAKVDYMHVFSLLSRLKQICNHPALLAKDPKNYKKFSSGKWDLFTELLNEAIESEQKVVVFSQYLYMLDIIENHLKEKGWGYAQIRGDTIDRKEELRRFQEDPNCLIFIGSLQAAGLGIDLTAASVVIMYDRWWNAARENQAIDRVHRIGQKWGVQVYKLITKNTIEEKIDRMITGKGKLFEDIVTADEQGVFKSFTRAELLDLLSFQDQNKD